MTERLIERQTPVPKSALEIPTANEVYYNAVCKALAKEGFTFVVAIEPLSIHQLAIDGRTYRPGFSYVDPSKNMRAIVPPQMEVAINPHNPGIENSNWKSTDIQIRKLWEQEAKLRGKLPEEVRDLISLRHMQNASVLAQIDFEYRKKTGKVFFTEWFGRTDDQTAPDKNASVGRLGSANGLSIISWGRDDDRGDIFAVLAAVLPRKDIDIPPLENPIPLISHSLK